MSESGRIDAGTGGYPSSAPYASYPDLDGRERRLHQLALVSNVATVTTLVGVLALLTYWQPLVGVLVFVTVGTAVTWQLIQTFTAGRKVLRSREMHPVDARTQPALYHLALDAAERVGIDLPPMYIAEDKTPNAFVALAAPSKPLVVVHTGLLKKFPPPAVKGVLAREFAHIRNKDLLVRSLAGALYQSAPRATDSRRQGMGTDVMMMFVLTYKLATALVFFAISRSRERLADATAARAVGSAAVLDCLRQLGEMVSDGGGTSMFSTHPGLRQRIETLADCCSRSASDIPADTP